MLGSQGKDFPVNIQGTNDFSKDNEFGSQPTDANVQSSPEAATPTFCQREISPSLKRLFDINFTRGDQCLVPCCGKYQDMTYLAFELGLFLTGIEVSKDKAAEFGKENLLSLDKALLESSGENIYRYRKSPYGGCITICCYDIFKLPPNDWAKNRKDPSSPSFFTGVYDRAAFAYIEPERRKEYVSIISLMLLKGSHILIEAYELDNKFYEAPPFSASRHDVEEAFHAHGFRTVSLNTEKVDNRAQIATVKKDAEKQLVKGRDWPVLQHTFTLIKCAKIRPEYR